MLQFVEPARWSVHHRHHWRDHNLQPRPRLCFRLCHLCRLSPCLGLRRLRLLIARPLYLLGLLGLRHRRHCRQHNPYHRGCCLPSFFDGAFKIGTAVIGINHDQCAPV